MRGRADAIAASVVSWKTTYAGRARGAGQLASPLDQRREQRSVGLGDLALAALLLRHVRTRVGDPLADVDVDIGGVGIGAGDGPLHPREPRARGAVGDAASDRALSRPTQREHPLGPAQRDVEETLFLVERLGRLGVGDRHEAALEAGDEHGVELEPLRPVEREQLDGVVTREAGVVAAERGLEEREETVDRPRLPRGRGARAALGVEVFVAEAHDRVDVLAPLLRQLVVGGRREVGEVLGERAARRRPRRLLQGVERHLDLGPLEEPPAATDTERHAGATERLFEERRLRVDAVEDGDARPGHVRCVSGAHRAARCRALRRRRCRTR